MNIEKGKISDLQLMFLITTFIMGSMTFISFADTITKHDSWLVITSGYVVSIPFVLSYVFLAKKFPKRNLIEINEIIYGTYLGKLISILYIWFMLTLLSLNLKGLADFYINFIMPDTPKLFFLIVGILTCAYALRKGIESMARISFIILALVTFIVIITFLFQIEKMDFSNFLPIFEIPITIYFQGVHTISIIQFCEIIVFLMVMPNLNSYKHTRKYALIGLTIAAFLLIIVSMQNTALLGIISPIFVSDTYESFRLVDIGNILTRMDILFALVITLVLFMKICIIFYATVTSISQLLHLRSHLPLILPIGSISVCLSMILFESIVEHNLHAANYHAILVTPFEFILPPVSLLIAKIRRLSK